MERQFPGIEGKSIRVRFLPLITVSRGKIVPNGRHGEAVHAGTHIRRRVMVLDRELCRDPRELGRIFIHELFHFVWVRLGNERRASYERLVRQELARGARGELGWSAESRKHRLTAGSRLPQHVKTWRDYLCESFCDTAAYLYSGLRRHDEFTLAVRWRRRRARWFFESFGGRSLSI